MSRTQHKSARARSAPVCGIVGERRARHRARPTSTVCYPRAPTLKRRVNFGLFASGALWLVACGGSAFTGSGGGSAGATSFAGATSSAGASTGGGGSGGATGTAGSSTGGAAHGGSSTGGAAHGGSSNGGSSTGGTAHGGSNNGGSNNGGSNNGRECNADSDCVGCAYPTAPQQASDCYCASCPSTSLSKAACVNSQAAWQAVCKGMMRVCPAVACVVPPVPVCKSGLCTSEKPVLP